DGRTLHFAVTPGARGSFFDGRLGVEKRREPVSFGAAFGSALSQPFEMLAVRLHPRPPLHADLVGPIGITRTAAPLCRPALAGNGLRRAALAGLGGIDVCALVALFLFPYRRRETAEPRSLPPSPPRPWVRLAARIVDLSVFLLVLGAISVAVNPGLIDSAG